MDVEVQFGHIAVPAIRPQIAAVPEKLLFAASAGIAPPSTITARSTLCRTPVLATRVMVQFGFMGGASPLLDRIAIYMLSVWTSVSSMGTQWRKGKQ